MKHFFATNNNDLTKEYPTAAILDFLNLVLRNNIHLQKHQLDTNKRDGNDNRFSCVV